MDFIPENHIVPDSDPEDERTDEINNNRDVVPLNISEAAAEATNELFPTKSHQRYQDVYKKFMDWRIKNGVTSFSEDVFLVYLQRLSETLQPPSLWATYSMLKLTMSVYHQINLHYFAKLTAFLKRKSEGYEGKKAKVFEDDQIADFLQNAPDNKYLFSKLGVIFGVLGALRRQELCDIALNDNKDTGENVEVIIPKSKTKISRKFVIPSEFYATYKKYADLRPKNVKSNRFFLTYRDGKCIRAPVGINTFGSLPKMVATYLNLENSDAYTGHSFRRTSVTMLANHGANIDTIKRHGGWKSRKLAEGYVEQSLRSKKEIGEQIGNAIFPKPSTITSGQFATYSRAETRNENSSTHNNQENIDVNNLPRNLQLSFHHCSNVSIHFAKDT